MNLHKLIFTNNACYKAGKKITVKGIMVHSTGANNPNLKRYVGPDDGLLGKNTNNNHWNQAMDRQVCVHGFIGKLADGTVATYQTLPWNYRGWHAGSGSKGSANNTHIGFEICEDGLTDETYFNAIYKEATEFCAYLCKQFNLDPTADGVIIGHYEGHTRGIASNHGDPRNWFPKFGKSMDTFRAEVKRLLDAEKKNDASTATETKTETAKTGAAETKTAETTTTASNIHIGDLVKITGSKYYNGKTIPGWVKKRKWVVYSVKGDRVVINKDESGKTSIMSPINADDIEVVKAVATTTETVTYKTYTVQSGDTLWGIAKKELGSGSRYTEIKTLNGMKSAYVSTGMVLKIPQK